MSKSTTTEAKKRIKASDRWKKRILSVKLCWNVNLSRDKQNILIMQLKLLRLSHVALLVTSANICAIEEHRFSLTHRSMLNDALRMQKIALKSSKFAISPLS